MLIPSIPTEDLFERAIAGDLDARQGLLIRGYRAMTRAARCQMGQESQDTLDVACDAWLRFQSKWSGWRRSGSFENYAAGFVHHAMLDLYRRRARLLLREPPREDRVYPEPERDADGRRLLERVARTIEELPGRQRDAFTRHLQGQPPDRIACEMEIAAATVRVHISHARKELVRRLFSSETDPEPGLRDSEPSYCLV